MQIVISKKIVLGFLAFLVLVGLPTTVYLTRQSQIFQQNAQVYQTTTHDTCNKLTIILSEVPVCPRLNGHGTNPGISSYTWTADIKSNDGKPHSINLTQFSDFCTEPYATGSPSQCNSNPISKTITVNSPYKLVITRAPTTGNACGTYQADLHISAIDNNTSCTYSGNNIGASGICETGITCTAASHTPTPKPSPSATPIPSKTPTPTTTPKPSSTPILSPTPPIPAICVPTESTCKWTPLSNIDTYHYSIEDTTSSTVIQQGDVSAPSVSFPSVPGETYKCSVSATNVCGTGGSVSTTKTCAVPTPTPTPVPSATPTPTVCVTPAPVINVRVKCSNCSQ